MKSPPRDVNGWVDDLTPAEFEEYERRYRWVAEEARLEQLTPPGDWKTWLYLAGRGAGKTRSAAEDVSAFGLDCPKSRIAVVAETFADGRDVCVEGESGLLSVLPPGSVRHWNRSLGELILTNGTRYKLYSGDKPNQLRGPQHHRAWCLSSGTPVVTDAGEKPIEDITPGDLVLTSQGYRPVSAVGSRVAQLYTLALVDGRTLTGSAEHPVATTEGFKPLSEIHSNDIIWAWKDDGERTPKVTSFATKEGASFTNTERCGSDTTARYRMVDTSITSTKTAPTTESKTCNLSRLASTDTYMSKSVNTFANDAEAPSSQKCTTDERSTANPAGGESENRGGSSTPETADTAAGSSRPALETIAVSGVSTLGLVGRVHNLTVEGQPEFFANGILTHNCDELAKYQYGDETWTQLQFGLRLGDNPQNVVTTTPRAIPLIKELVTRDNVIVTTGSTFDNAANLSETFLEEVRLLYEGTSLGDQELYGRIVELDGDAIFDREWFKHNRWKNDANRVVIGRWLSFDMAMKDKEDSAYNAMTVFELDEHWSLDVRYAWRERLSFPKLMPKLTQFAYDWNYDGLLMGLIVEDKAHGITAAQTIQESSDEWLADILIPFDPGDKSKEVRWNQAAVWAQKGQIRLPEPGPEHPYLYEYEEELYALPNAKYKDWADTFSQGVIYLEHQVAQGYRTRVGMVA